MIADIWKMSTGLFPTGRRKTRVLTAYVDQGDLVHKFLDTANQSKLPADDLHCKILDPFKIFDMFLNNAGTGLARGFAMCTSGHLGPLSKIGVINRRN